MSHERAYAQDDERRRQQMQAAYEERRRIADRMEHQMGEAIAACGLGADDYGKHFWQDVLKHEPDFVVYWRRDKGIPGFQPTSEEIEAANPWLDEAVWTTGFCLRRHGDKMVKVMEAYQIWRWSLCWANFELYDPRTPEQLEQLRQSRAKKKAEREERKEREQFPLLYWTEAAAK